MRPIRIGIALAGLIVLGVGLAVPAHSEPGDSPDDKQSEIERLRSYEPTPEEEALDAAQLADEAQRLAYSEIADPAISPGLGFAADGSAVIRVFSGADSEAVEQELKRQGLQASVVPSQYTETEKAALEAALSGIKLDEDEAFGFHYDALRDAVVVTGNVSKDKIEAAVGQRVPYEFDQTENASRASRLSDGVPHYGGAKITASSGSCTSGFTVNAAGAYRMVTAGHCGSIGTSWSSPGGQYFGQLQHRAAFPAYDLAMISYSTYIGIAYTGGHPGVPYLVSSSIGDPGLGGGYCSGGAVSTEKCPLSVASKTASFCDSQGCTSPILSYTGGAPALGDSGAPFYAKGSGAYVHIRGVVIALAGSVGYAEPWNRVANRFGATIVVG